MSGCAKYIARGSLWEAFEALHRARAQLWRLWAVTQEPPDPQYGLTALFDAPKRSLPLGIETTIARLDREDIARAALACADLLFSVWPSAAGKVSDRPLSPPPLAQWVRRQLATIPAEGRRPAT